MVNAIAPPAPIGASCMMAFIMVKKMSDADSMNRWTGSPAGPMRSIA